MTEEDIKVRDVCRGLDKKKATPTCVECAHHVITWITETESTTDACKKSHEYTVYYMVHGGGISFNGLISCKKMRLDESKCGHRRII